MFSWIGNLIDPPFPSMFGTFKKKPVKEEDK